MGQHAPKEVFPARFGASTKNPFGIVARPIQYSASQRLYSSLISYIRVDFEIINEKEYKNILVPGFFYYEENGKADPRFLDLGKAAGLTRDYGKDLKSVLRDLIGRKLCIFVNHRYKNGRRRERAEDFKPLNRNSDDEEELPNEAGDLPF